MRKNTLLALGFGRRDK